VVSPISSLPKSRLEGDTDGAVSGGWTTNPVPVIVAVLERLFTVSVTIREPTTVPDVEGLNVTAM
jgi:hypothetical protein